jgi:hypothetical protein
VATASRPLSDRAFALVAWGLAFHVFAMAVLHGPLEVPPSTVRLVASWKELVLLPLLGLAAWQLARRPERFRPLLPDVAVVALSLIVFARTMLDWAWLDFTPWSPASVYGARDLLVPFVLYAVGRMTPELLEHPRLLGRLTTVALVVACIGFVERLLPIEALVLAGIPAYFRDFLNLESMTDPAFFGLPHSYFTDLGSVAFRRAGSVFLSGQSFAIALMLLLPALQLKAMAATGGGRPARWTAFALGWVALLLTVTRMTIVACAVQAVLLLVLTRRTLAVGGLVALGTGIAGMAVLGSSAVRDFVWRTVAFQTQSSASHVADWSDGVVALWEHPVGAGLGTTDLTAARLGREPLTADNLLFKYAVELGWPGLVALVAFFVGVVACTWQVAQRREGPVRQGAQLALAVTVGIIVNGATGVVTNLTFLAYLWSWITGAAIAHMPDRAAPPAA